MGSYSRHFLFFVTYIRPIRLACLFLASSFGLVLDYLIGPNNTLKRKRSVVNWDLLQHRLDPSPWTCWQNLDRVQNSILTYDLSWSVLVFIKVLRNMSKRVPRESQQWSSTGCEESWIIFTTLYFLHNLWMAPIS
jgi:hypothetical protein